MSTNNQSDITNIFPYGMGLETFGLVVQNATNGYGLVTRGLLWQGYDIWLNTSKVSGISTSWSTYTFGASSTTWTAYSFGATSTTWTDSEFGIFQEYPSRLP